MTQLLGWRKRLEAHPQTHVAPAPRWFAPRIVGWVLSRWLPRVVMVCATLGVVSAAVCAWLWNTQPFPVAKLDRWPSSPRVTDRAGGLMMTVVGRDDQWRFPVPLERISDWMTKATIAVEDERFYSHPGVDTLAVVRALGQDVIAGRIVSGASTITMQVCRMIDDRRRTLRAKLVESFRALQLEQLRDKRQILEAYLNIAPFGGNLRGVEAASRFYFNKSAADLALPEASLLAGLPQSPARLRPDRFPAAAAERRRIVLQRMVDVGAITSQQAAAAAVEPILVGNHSASMIAGRPFTSQQGFDQHDAGMSAHAAWLALQRRPEGGRTTIDRDIQRELQRAVARSMQSLPGRSQIAVVAIDVDRSEIVGLVGAGDPGNAIDGQVNGALARRSPGSALKPFVYAAAIEAGLLNDASMVFDVPIVRAGWTPANFDRKYVGEVSMAEALRRSLNVPAILVAEAAGLPRCLGLIEAAGVDLPDDVQSRGWLAVVVGATEVRLLDLVNGYATLARGGVRRSPRLFVDESDSSAAVISTYACDIINDVLSSRHRRPRGMQDRSHQSLPWFMWKTGTSSGRRDAWAVGHNYRYAVGVWIGRFCGSGAAEYVGFESAEPLLAMIFELPRMRNDQEPTVPQRRPVPHPLAPPSELAEALRILAPASGARYIAAEGTVIVRPRATRESDLTWFLNGSLIDQVNAQRLALAPGSYQLRCVDLTGQSAAVDFVVLDRPTRGFSPG